MRLVMKEQSFNHEVFTALFLQILRIALKYDHKETIAMLDSFNFKYEILKDD